MNAARRFPFLGGTLFPAFRYNGIIWRCGDDEHSALGAWRARIGAAGVKPVWHLVGAAYMQRDRQRTMSLAACRVALFIAGANVQAGATCHPVSVDVVSLGEKAARVYGERSLAREIAEQRRTLTYARPDNVRIVRQPLECRYFPNIIAADEWRCTGSAKLCTD